MLAMETAKQRKPGYYVRPANLLVSSQPRDTHAIYIEFYCAYFCTSILHCTSWAFLLADRESRPRRDTTAARTTELLRRRRSERSAHQPRLLLLRRPLRQVLPPTLSLVHSRLGTTSTHGNHVKRTANSVGFRHSTQTVGTSCVSHLDD